MNKVKVSKEWTLEERLAVIDAIVLDWLNNGIHHSRFTLIDMHTIITGWPDLLERNRKNFAYCVEDKP